MKGLVMVAWREIVQRRMLLLAAIFASVVVWIVPAARGLTGIDAPAVRHLTALLFAAVFAVGTSVVLGATMLAPAVANRKIAFDFARPLSAFAIWTGRLLAAVVLAGGSAAIIWILAGVRDTSTLPVDLPGPLWATTVLAVACLVVLFALFHAVAVAILSRSSWIVVDVVLVGVVTVILVAARRHLPNAPEPWFFYRLIFLFCALAAATSILTVAGYASIVRGRSDIRAAHRALSIALWPPILAAALGAYGFVRWVEAATPANLSRVWRAFPSPVGDWTVVLGTARGFSAAFLYDTSSGSFSKLAADDEWPAFSADGRRAAWSAGRPEGEHWKGPFPVRILDLTNPGASVVRTRLLLSDPPSLAVLSADGSRLATVAKGILSIHDVDASRTLASARVASVEVYPRGFFVSPNLFRFYRVAEVTKGQARLDILEFDVATRRLETTGSSPLLSPWCHLAADPKGERLIVVDNQSKETWLLDGRGGSHLATLAAALPEKNRSIGFLSDGRAVITDDSSDRKGKLLRVFTRDGASAREVPFPGAEGLALGGELAPGQLIAAVGDGVSRQIELVAVDSGERRRIGGKLFPVARLSNYWNPTNEAPAVGSNATRLFYRDEETLIRLDPATGQQRVLLGKDAAH